MKYQTTPYSCGAAAVVNALRCLGKKVPERVIQKISFTSEKNGTDEHGIIAALRSLGFDGSPFNGSFDDAFAELESELGEGYPVILCTWDMQHWVTAIGKLGKYPGNGTKIVIFDPSRSKSNKGENGVKILTRKQLKKSWKSRDGKFYGIACFKKVP